MVKVESGLFNELRGTLNKSRTTFQTRKSGIVAEKKPIPPKDARGRRECVRWIYRYLCDKWNTLSEQEKEQYSETAEKHSITLFNAFLKEELSMRLWKCKLAKLDGQVLYLPFVEGEGNVTRDFSGYGNHGTIYGATWQKLANDVNVLYFDGVDDYVEIPHKDILKQREAITQEVWIYYISSNEVYAQIIGPATYPRILIYALSNQVMFQIRINNTFYSLYTNTRINPSTWYHIVATYDSEIGKMRVYINGVKDTTEVSVTGLIDENTAPYRIGAFSSTTYRLNGFVALACVYNRALTEEEIKQHYELTKPYFE